MSADELDLVTVLVALGSGSAHEVEGFLSDVRPYENVALLHSVHSPIFAIADLV